MEGARGLGWLFFGVGYLGWYLLQAAWTIPVLWYRPTDGHLAFATRLDGVSMDFYGRLLECLAVGALSGLAARWAFRNAPEARWKAWRVRATAWCGTLLVFAAAWYVYNLVGRRSEPAPLPASYVPR